MVNQIKAIYQFSPKNLICIFSHQTQEIKWEEIFQTRKKFAFFLPFYSFVFFISWPCFKCLFSVWIVDHLLSKKKKRFYFFSLFEDLPLSRIVYWNDRVLNRIDCNYAESRGLLELLVIANSQKWLLYICKYMAEKFIEYSSLQPYHYHFFMINMGAQWAGFVQKLVKYFLGIFFGLFRLGCHFN